MDRSLCETSGRRAGGQPLLAEMLLRNLKEGFRVEGLGFRDLGFRDLGV